MSKALFDKLFDRLIAHEGGYVNHPRDPGGETNWGITKRTALANGYSGQMRQMTREQAREIYYRAFWLRYQCDELPEAVSWQFFDAAVNHGNGNAACAFTPNFPLLAASAKAGCAAWPTTSAMPPTTMQTGWAIVTKKLLIALTLAALGRTTTAPQIVPTPAPIALIGFPVPSRRSGVAQARRAARKSSVAKQRRAAKQRRKAKK